MLGSQIFLFRLACYKGGRSFSRLLTLLLRLSSPDPSVQMTFSCWLGFFLPRQHPCKPLGLCSKEAGTQRFVQNCRSSSLHNTCTLSRFLIAHPAPSSSTTAAIWSMEYVPLYQAVNLVTWSEGFFCR